MAIEKRLQVKYNQVISKYQGHFSKPVYKFIRQVVYGMLKTQHVHLSKIACSLNERISLKKTWERLSRNMGRAGLAEEVMASHIQENSREFKRKKYWVVDLTDISKVYANAMEGLGGIWDGSKGKAGKGYWVVNVAGISPRDESISLMYSELFSLDHELEKDVSENKKILSAISELGTNLDRQGTVVIDRGGDRRRLIENFLYNKQEFIVRQRGDRHIHNSQKNLKVKQYAKEIDCPYQMTVRKTRHGKQRVLQFNGGAKRVWFPKEFTGGVFNKPLWLVRLRRKSGKGESWYLCDLAVETAQEAVEMVIEGYGCRWKIEEVHRQIKQDYHLESVRLQRYRALKNFNAIFWTAMNFIYQHLESLCVDLVMQCEEKLSYKLSINDFTGFIYYKLSKAVRLILSKHRLNDLSRQYLPNPSDQLVLAIE